MCLQMAPLHAVNSGIGGTALAIGGVVFTGVGTFVGVFVYKIRDRIKKIFRRN